MAAVCTNCGKEKTSGPLNTAATKCAHGVSLKTHCCACSGDPIWVGFMCNPKK